VLKDFDQMHQTLHAWQPGTLERINGILALARPGAPAKAALTPGLAAILQDAHTPVGAGRGLFNPAIGNLVRLWGFHSDTFEARLPDPGEIERLVKARPRMTDLHIDGLMLTGANPAARLDLGGYAKGHALDLAAAYLKSQGVRNALINIGGNIMALGSKGGRPVEAWASSIRAGPAPWPPWTSRTARPSAPRAITSASSRSTANAIAT
jgi:thiamine biosynthesis lipoprotein